MRYRVVRHRNGFGRTIRNRSALCEAPVRLDACVAWRHVLVRETTNRAAPAMVGTVRGVCMRRARCADRIAEPMKDRM